MSEKDKMEMKACEPCEVDVKRVEARTFKPAVDVLERPDDVLVVADLPGVKSGDVEVEYEDGHLSLVARANPVRNPSGKMLLREYELGEFKRTFRIGDGIDAAGIEAEMKEGVLTLRLPKKKSEVARKIPVRSSSTS